MYKTNPNFFSFFSLFKYKKTVWLLMAKWDETFSFATVYMKIFIVIYQKINDLMSIFWNDLSVIEI